MHPEVRRFIDQFEKSRKGRQKRNRIGTLEAAFLEMVWGPTFLYNFDGLAPEHPWRDFQDGSRFADFVYTKGNLRLLIEVDGFATHARDITQDEFDDHLARQNALVLQGWMILRFSARQVKRSPMDCGRQIMQAIGHWWTIVNRDDTAQADLWKIREKALIELLMRNGSARLVDVQRHFGIAKGTSAKWMAHFLNAGLVAPERSGRYVVRYRLAGSGA